jgi:hypothetical protein
MVESLKRGFAKERLLASCPHIDARCSSFATPFSKPFIIIFLRLLEVANTLVRQWLKLGQYLLSRDYFLVRLVEAAWQYLQIVAQISFDTNYNKRCHCALIINTRLSS